MQSNPSVMLWPLQGTLEEQLEMVAAAGFEEVGFVSEPSRWSPHELSTARAGLRRHGLTPVLMSATPNWRAADRSMLDEAARPNALREVSASIQLATELEIATLLLLTGERLPGVSSDTQLAALTETCKRCAELAERAGVTLLLEPLNDKIDHPGYFLNDCSVGADIVRAVASPHLRLLFDVYHQEIQASDAIEALASVVGCVSMIHLADAPGRHEPGTGRIDWNALRLTLHDSAYAGALALEFLPEGNPLESLRRARRATAST